MAIVLILLLICFDCDLKDGLSLQELWKKKKQIK